MTTQYQVRGPDGQVHVFAGPDGATPDQVIDAAQQFFGAQSSAHQKAAADTAAWQATITPTDGMGTLDRVLAGAGKGMTDLARGAGERLGLVSPADVAASRQQDGPLMATTSGKVGNFIGQAVPIAAASVLVPGSGTLAGSTGIGATQGLLQPTTADESVLKNVAVGAAGGAAGYGAGKAIGAGVRAGKAAAQPFYESGKQQIIGRALNRAAGDNAPTVANSLEEAAAPFVGPSQPGLARATMGEIVPGSIPTVGQAAGNPGVAALERAAVATQPDVTNQVTAQLGQQNAARAGLLQDMAGTGGARDFAAAERAATSDQLYGQARANGVNPAALSPEAQANIAQMQARIPAPILAEAKSLAQINGMPMDDTTSIAGMHYVKQALDDAISSAKASGNSTRAAALTGLQKDYLAGMDALSPDYAAARATHAAMSEPINQMDVAQRLLDKSQNPLTGAIQPAAFARNLNDKTASAATGFQGATLDNTMTNQQNNLLQAILEDLQRSSTAQNAGRGAGSDTVQKLAYSDLMKQAGAVPGASAVAKAATGIPVLGRLADPIKDAYANAGDELSSRLAQTMMSPADAAAAMRAAAVGDEPNPLLQLLTPYLLRTSGVAPAALALQGSR